jgi:hypothetical protein
MLLKITIFAPLRLSRKAGTSWRTGHAGVPDQGLRLTAEKREAVGEVGIEGPVPRGLEPPTRTVDERE